MNQPTELMFQHCIISYAFALIKIVSLRLFWVMNFLWGTPKGCTLLKGGPVLKKFKNHCPKNTANQTKFLGLIALKQHSESLNNHITTYQKDTQNCSHPQPILFKNVLNQKWFMLTTQHYSEYLSNITFNNMTDFNTLRTH